MLLVIRFSLPFQTHTECSTISIMNLPAARHLGSPCISSPKLSAFKNMAPITIYTTSLGCFVNTSGFFIYVHEAGWPLIFLFVWSLSHFDIKLILVLLNKLENYFLREF